MEKQRKHYSAEFKYKLVKEVLLTDKSVSSACREYGISAGMYYKWQEQFLASAKNGFEPKTEGAEARLSQQKDLEITKLKNVIAELTTDLIELKKKNSDLM